MLGCEGESVENSRYVGDDLVAAKPGRWPPRRRIRGECGRRVRGAPLFDIDEIDSGPDNLEVTAANGTAMAENLSQELMVEIKRMLHQVEPMHSRAIPVPWSTDLGPTFEDGIKIVLQAALDYRRLRAIIAGAPVPSLYIPKPQTHFIAEDDVSALSQPSTASRDTDEDSFVDVIDTQTWALSLNHRPRPCVAHHPKTSPDAQGQPQAHLINMMVLHSDDYGVPTAPEQQTGRRLRPLQEVTCIVRFYPVSAMLDPAGPMMDLFATMRGVTPKPPLADGRDARRAYDTAEEEEDFILIDGEVEL